jgi:hypothetical protein
LVFSRFDCFVKLNHGTLMPYVGGDHHIRMQIADLLNTMKITNKAVETIDINLNECSKILHLMFMASEQPKNINEPLQAWNN